MLICLLGGQVVALERNESDDETTFAGKLIRLSHFGRLLRVRRRRLLLCLRASTNRRRRDSKRGRSFGNRRTETSPPTDGSTDERTTEGDEGVCKHVTN